MYKKILVPLALDHGVSERTLATAKALCAEDGSITALHVYEIPRGTVSTFMGEDHIQQGFDAAFAALKEKARTVPNVKVEIVKGHAYRSIVEFSKQGDFDCIVMGSHKPDVSDFLIGSTAARVVRHAPCTVHVHRE
ncbi:universal stress protein [Shimia haliotis]|uniref:Nucleotide-binding universal stress protein, UspA family n=1 Tax=Shimia haliotis TaxID=1280847 RepID=A0A1I4CZ93_9RHOB|nr:universal stress protein [Shimia haliotis]SFK86215.1 Nucleotide-binding universal stress protein, UspA family [Shimia haliotis]